MKTDNSQANEEDQVEHFNGTSDSQKKEEGQVEHFNGTSGAAVGSTYALIHFVAAIFAIYLSFKCNKGFRLGPFLVALCCPWIYIIWIAATHGFNFCHESTPSLE